MVITKDKCYFLKMEPAKVLLEIGNNKAKECLHLNYRNKLFKNLGINLLYLTHMIGDLLKLDFIKENVEGRIKYLDLTPKGEQMVEFLKKVMDLK